jgi:hypothetical protein
MTRKQSPIDRAMRLAQGRCPIHGRVLTQASEWFCDDSGLPATLVECAVCRAALAIEHEPFGPASLLPAFEYLIAPSTARVPSFA